MARLLAFHPRSFHPKARQNAWNLTQNVYKRPRAAAAEAEVDSASWQRSQRAKSNADFHASDVREGLEIRAITLQEDLSLQWSWLQETAGADLEDATAIVKLLKA